MSLHIELAARMPWLYAPGYTHWIATGTYADGTPFTDVLAYAVPYAVTGVLDGAAPATFRISTGGTEQRYVPADRITRGRQVLLVWADDPRTAFDEHEQDALDRALSDR